MKFVISVLFFLLLVFGYKAQVPSYVPSNGLVGWWPFNGNANDASSNGNNGTVNGAVLTTDRFGNVSSAYDFHQTGHITLPSLNVTSITINAWVKRLPGPVGAPAIVSKHYTSSTTNSSYLLYHQEAEACVPKIYYTNTVGSPFAEAATGKNDCDDAWHMITGVVSAAQIKIYYDGILVSTNSNGGSIKSSTFNTLIGRSYANNGALSATTFGGKIDDVGVWNRALSDCEVAGLYFAGNPLSISVSNKIICSGQTATLSTDPSVLGGSYLWSTNASSSSISISPTTTTNYSVTYNYGSCNQATTTASVFVGNSSSWTGSSDSDWHKPCNWNPQAVPTCCQSVYIPLTANQPVISGTASCKDISIESSSGALLTVNSNANLQIETCPNISTQNICIGSITSINCASALTTGTFISGQSITNGNSVIPYSGGDGGNFNGQVFTSTGVTGLTAVLSQGNFANGSGNITLSISGTPSTSGLASFMINIGGQSCTLSITITSLASQYPTGSVFCASGPTAIVDVTNPTTGKTWMDRNLGASQVATSSTDAAAYGDLYQWGRRSDGHQCRNSATTTTLSSIDQPAHGNFILVSGSIPGDWRNPQNNNLWQGISGVNNPCPSGYRIPTEIEMNNERLSWVSNNGPGAFSSPLKWNLAGYRMKNNGTLSSTAVMGSYWTSTSTGTNSYGISFLNNDGYLNGAERSYGLSIRCIKETIGSVGTLNCGSTSVNGNLISGTSANGVSASVPYTVGNGGFYAAQSVTSTGVTGLTISISQGLFASGSGNLVYTISGTPSASGTASFVLNIGGQTCNLNITVNSVQPAYPTGSVFCASGPTLVNDVTNPTTGKTWMDRNLGASQIATSLTDQNAYGDLYQWGRRSDGHQCRNSGTTNTLSSTNTPIHGNFIISPNSPIDWRNPQNTNLWQGVNGVNNPCPSGYRVPSQMEMYNEQISWPSNDGTGAFSSVLMWTLAGSRIGPSAVFIEVNTDGYYWNSNTLGLQSSVLRIQNNSEIYFDNRADALSIRCIKETVGSIGALNCGGTTIIGNLISGAAASGVSSTVPYTGGNGGFYAAQSVSSTGVSGLTASISQGLFASGAGNLVFTISGTPSASGTATFVLNIGGQSCTLSITVTSLASQYPTGSVFCASGPTAIIDVTNPTTGRTWMDRNLGASQVATSSTDAAAYGDLYQWGRGNDGHQCRNSTTTTSFSSSDTPNNSAFILSTNSPFDWRNPQNNSLWIGLSGINNPCPSGYRLPSLSELDAERLTWTSNNLAGAISSNIRLPAGSSREFGNGSILNIGTMGFYWSSNISNTMSQSLPFTSTNAYVNNDYRARGGSVRCIKN